MFTNEFGFKVNDPPFTRDTSVIPSNAVPPVVKVLVPPKVRLPLPVLKSRTPEAPAPFVIVNQSGIDRLYAQLFKFTMPLEPTTKLAAEDNAPAAPTCNAPLLTTESPI